MATNAGGNSETIDALCPQCGQTFTAFLQEMADQNEKVVCPSCRESLNCQPGKDAKPVTNRRPVHKPH